MRNILANRYHNTEKPPFLRLFASFLARIYSDLHTLVDWFRPNLLCVCCFYGCRRSTTSASSSFFSLPTPSKSQVRALCLHFRALLVLFLIFPLFLFLVYCASQNQQQVHRSCRFVLTRRSFFFSLWPAALWDGLRPRYATRTLIYSAQRFYTVLRRW